MDFYFKAESKEIAAKTLVSLGLMREDHIPVDRVSITGYGGIPDVTIWSVKPEFGESGECVVEGIKTEEYHFNVRDNAHVIEEDQTDFGPLERVFPESPTTVWS